MECGDPYWVRCSYLEFLSGKKGNVQTATVPLQQRNSTAVPIRTVLSRQEGPRYVPLQRRTYRNSPAVPVGVSGSSEKEFVYRPLGPCGASRCTLNNSGLRPKSYGAVNRPNQARSTNRRIPECYQNNSQNMKSTELEAVRMPLEYRGFAGFSPQKF